MLHFPNPKRPTQFFCGLARSVKMTQKSLISVRVPWTIAARKPSERKSKSGAKREKGDFNFRSSLPITFSPRHLSFTQAKKRERFFPTSTLKSLTTHRPDKWKRKKKKIAEKLRHFFTKLWALRPRIDTFLPTRKGRRPNLMMTFSIASGLNCPIEESTTK